MLAGGVYWNSEYQRRWGDGHPEATRVATKS